MNNPADGLKSARRQLDSLSRVNILEDWQYDKHSSRWYIKLQICNDVQHSFIPIKSDWYVTVEESYPRGSIKVYPSISNSIEVTFPHQSNNGNVAKNQLWRLGNLCLSVSLPRSSEIGYGEPRNTEGRLLWHVTRAISWISAASKGTLQKDGDFFELPQFINISMSTFAFSEDIITYMQWEDVEEQYGYADVSKCMLGNWMHRVNAFKGVKGEVVHSTRWGAHLSKKESTEQVAIWILLEHIPTVNLWQAPNTMSELTEALKFQKIDLWGILKRLLRNIRDGQQHLFLLGFPIPKVINGANQIIFWQALRLPVISHGNKFAHGFRKSEKGYWQRDKTEVLSDDHKLEWIESQNWNQEEITSRGRMNDIFLRKKILLIGAGCIGSTLAELVVRAGTYSLTVMDGDILEIGNLSRHVLTIDEIGELKVVALKKYLDSINPNVDIQAVSKRFSDSDLMRKKIMKYDIVIDCTGSSDVLDIIRSTKLKSGAIFASLAIGIGAKQVFLFIAKNGTDNFGIFIDLLKKYIDPTGITDEKLPRDGIGCWHPLFPARSEDIWLASSTALKVLENYVVDDTEKSLSIVFEQNCYNNIFTGYRVVEYTSK